MILKTVFLNPCHYFVHVNYFILQFYLINMNLDLILFLKFKIKYFFSYFLPYSNSNFSLNLYFNLNLNFQSSKFRYRIKFYQFPLKLFRYSKFVKQHLQLADFNFFLLFPQNQLIIIKQKKFNLSINYLLYLYYQQTIIITINYIIQAYLLWLYYYLSFIINFNY